MMSCFGINSLKQRDVNKVLVTTITCFDEKRFVIHIYVSIAFVIAN